MSLGQSLMFKKDRLACPRLIPHGTYYLALAQRVTLSTKAWTMRKNNQCFCLCCWGLILRGHSCQYTLLTIESHPLVSQNVNNVKGEIPIICCFSVSKAFWCVVVYACIYCICRGKCCR